jgi:RHS repeat-associated protein
MDLLMPQETDWRLAQSLPGRGASGVADPPFWAEAESVGAPADTHTGTPGGLMSVAYGEASLAGAEGTLSQPTVQAVTAQAIRGADAIRLADALGQASGPGGAGMCTIPSWDSLRGNPAAEEGVYSEEGAADSIAAIAVNSPEESANTTDSEFDFEQLMISPHRVVGQTGIEFDVSYYHVDHLGTPRLITDPAGNVVTYHKYDPFGEELQPLGSPNTHQFTGHERDQATGLDYMLARYYSAGIGRFLAPDLVLDAVSLEMPQSWNKYSYVSNNPMRLLDPSGRVTQDAINTVLTDNAALLSRSPAAYWRIYPGGSSENSSILKQISQENGTTPIRNGHGWFVLGLEDRTSSSAGSSSEGQTTFMGVMWAAYSIDAKTDTDDISDSMAQGAASAAILQRSTSPGPFQDNMSHEAAQALIQGVAAGGGNVDAAIDAANKALSTDGLGGQYEKADGDEEAEAYLKVTYKILDEDGNDTGERTEPTFIPLKRKD